MVFDKYSQFKPIYTRYEVLEFDLSSNSFTKKIIKTANSSLNFAYRYSTSVEDWIDIGNNKALILSTAKVNFSIPSVPNACFYNPGHPNSDPKIIRKSNLEIDMNKSCFLIKKYQKSSQNRSPKSTKNR